MPTPKVSPDISTKPSQGFHPGWRPTNIKGRGEEREERWGSDRERERWERGEGEETDRQTKGETEREGEMIDTGRDVLALQRGWLGPLGWEEGHVLVLSSQRNSLICHHMV